ncbi:MAG: sugar kinase [Chitinophagaceae bacterium]|nr:sugar kinase [Chitinophagaceae bacterium]
MENRNYILAIGELLIDGITSTAVDNLSQATSMNIRPGGSTANFCRYLKRCRTDAEIVAAVGNDGLGEILLRKLKEDGLSTDHVLQLDDRVTSMVVVAKTAGTPDFLPYRDADKFIAPIDEALIARSSMVHSTAFALSHEPARTHILEAFNSASAQQIPVSVDWNYAEKIWGRNNDAQQVFKQIQIHKPLFKFSMDDIQRFLGKALSIEDARYYLQDLPATAICLTCGPEGVYYRDITGDWKHVAAKKIHIRSATGAGDAFWAGFISAWHKKYSLEQCVITGVETAAIKLEGKWHAGVAGS